MIDEKEKDDEDKERQMACYEQNCQQFRSLNQQMNQVPTFGITLTGGLWYAAGAVQGLDGPIRFALLVFAGFSNLALILTVLRIRDVIASYLEKIEEFYPLGFVPGKPKKPKIPLGDYSMISIYCALAGLASVFSFAGAFLEYWPFQVSKSFGVVTLLIMLLILGWWVFRKKKKSTPTLTGA